MSKRPGSPIVEPIKLVKVEENWAIAPSIAVEVEKPPVSRPTFKPISAGSRARILQSYVLSYKPELVATISLCGNQPEVRFVSVDSSICITGDELLQLANCRHQWPTNPVFLLNTRLEPLEDGSFRFARYSSLSEEPPSPAQIMDIFPTAIFDMPKYAVQRLKTKLDVMSEHVFRILESEPTINQMFDSIVQMYKQEYARLVSLQPIANHFDELCRLVECHVQPSHIVKHFCFHSAGSRWNLYALLASALSQRSHIKSML